MNKIQKNEFSLLYRDMYHYRLKNNLVQLTDFFKEMFSTVNNDDSSTILNPLMSIQNTN